MVKVFFFFSFIFSQNKSFPQDNNSAADPHLKKKKKKYTGSVWAGLMSPQFWFSSGLGSGRKCTGSPWAGLNFFEPNLNSILEDVTDQQINQSEKGMDPITLNRRISKTPCEELGF